MRLREFLTEITLALRAILPAQISDRSEITKILFLQGHNPAAEVCVLGGERITDKGWHPRLALRSEPPRCGRMATTPRCAV